MSVLADRVPQETLDYAQVVVSELVTNSVRHTPTDSVEVRAGVLDRVLRIEVTDEGPGFRPDPQPPTDRLRPHGNGLYVVDQLVERWGVEKLPDNGSTVWAELGFPKEQG